MRWGKRRARREGQTRARAALCFDPPRRPATAHGVHTRTHMPAPTSHQVCLTPCRHIGSASCISLAITTLQYVIHIFIPGRQILIAHPIILVRLPPGCGEKQQYRHTPNLTCSSRVANARALRCARVAISISCTNFRCRYLRMCGDGQLCRSSVPSGQLSVAGDSAIRLLRHSSGVPIVSQVDSAFLESGCGDIHAGRDSAETLREGNGVGKPPAAPANISPIAKGEDKRG